MAWDSPMARWRRYDVERKEKRMCGRKRETGGDCREWLRRRNGVGQIAGCTMLLGLFLTPSIANRAVHVYVCRFGILSPHVV